jgi:hypothetical protein
LTVSTGQTELERAKGIFGIMQEDTTDRQDKTGPKMVNGIT